MLAAINRSEKFKQMEKRKINIVLADEHQLMIEGLIHMLEHCEKDFEIKVCQSVNSGDDLLEVSRNNGFDLVIMDIKLPVIDGMELIYEIKEMNPNCRILILTMYDSNKFVKNAFKQGVDGYVLKKTNCDELVSAIEEVMNGSAYMGNGVSISPSKNGIRRDDEDEQWVVEDNFLLKNYLTKRELEIINEIALHKNNKDIAKNLYISDQTVSVHRKNIMRKLNVSTNDGLIKLAVDRGLVSLSD